MSREDMGDPRVTIDGVDTGTWAKLSGGDLDSSETKFPPGAMAPEVSLGGTQSTDNVTLQRLFVIGRDDVLLTKLADRRGKARVVVKRQPLDPDGNASGRAVTYKGILKRVAPPDIDSESDDAGLIEIEVSVDALVAA